MSDNKYNRSKPSKYSADQTIRNENFKKAALSKSKYRPLPLTPGEVIIEKAKTITLAVRKQIHPILASGGWQDQQSLRALLMTLYLQAFDATFHKDDLVQLCAVMHVEAIMESIAADPFDSGKPDLLSGI